MGRLTEAFGLLNVSASKFSPEWIKFNCTSLIPSDELKSLRRTVAGAKLSQKRREQKALDQQIETNQ